MGRKKNKGTKRPYERDGPDDRDFPDADLPVILVGGHGSGMSTISSTSVKTPPPNPENIARAMAALTTVSLGMPETFTTPINYVVMGNGIFKVQNTVLGKLIQKVEGLPTVKDHLTPGFQLSVPKIPFDILAQVYGFFRAVCEKAKKPVEAYCQVWYSTEGNIFFLKVPEQDVSGASVKHEGHSIPTDKMIHVADIHSHGSMGAFFSGVDDADEKTQGVRIFGVIGNIMTGKPSMKWRIGRGDGTFIENVNVTDVVEITSTVSVKIPLHQLLGESVTVTVKDFNPWPKVETPKEWLDAVTTESKTQYSGHRSGYHTAGGSHLNRGNDSSAHSAHSSQRPNPGFVDSNHGIKPFNSYMDKDGEVWDLTMGKGWVKRESGKTSSPTEGGTGVSGTKEVSQPVRTFHTRIGTFVVGKGDIRHVPIVGKQGLGGVRD